MNPPDQKKSVLITGCSSGIGRCVADGLRERGYRVFASARKTEDVSVLEAAGFESLQLDLDDSDSINNAVDQLLQRTGGALYGLFNNGGFGQTGALEDISREAMRAQFETNLFGWHELTRRFIPLMRDQGEGRIILNSSVLGFVALAYRGPYNAVKFAVEGWADTLRLELRGTGVHVSLIEPGPIESDFRANALTVFEKNVDIENSIHRAMYQTWLARLKAPGPTAPFTLGPEAVLDKVVHALESRRPRPRYPVTVPTRVFAVLKRLLPDRLMDRVLGRVSRGEHHRVDKGGKE